MILITFAAGKLRQVRYGEDQQVSGAGYGGDAVAGSVVDLRGRKHPGGKPVAMPEKLHIITVFQPDPGYGHGCPIAERLEELDTHRLIYHLPRPGLDGRTQLILSPLELIGRIAALVPPPRQYRHRYYGVLAPNAPLRAAVTALAPETVAA